MQSSLIWFIYAHFTASAIFSILQTYDVQNSVRGFSLYFLTESNLL